MTDRLIQFALRNRTLVLAAAALLLVFGAHTAWRMQVDVFPDLTAPTVAVITEAHGMAPLEDQWAALADILRGIGPVVAVPKELKLARLSLSEIDLFELNEAFAAQSVAVMRELDLDPDKTNVNGGAIALGHPLGCTGAKLTTQLLHEMKRRGVQFGMVTMCIGGGMGAAGIFENLN